jgi:extracellular factor (EF) 3-hydroxypalmitic acid methyl ester biosynthesis protein
MNSLSISVPEALEHATTSSSRPTAAQSSFIESNYVRLRNGDVSGMSDFVENLNSLRKSLSLLEWQRFIKAVFSCHPIRDVIHEDPFSRHAFQKPRGYAGDADLLDLIYGDTPYSGPLTALGANLYKWSTSQPACRSVQERRVLLAQLIDQVAQQRPRPRILSVACGHLREARWSNAVREGAVEEFVAIDQDGESLAVIGKELGTCGVRAVRASIRRLLVCPTMYGAFDLVYSAGLYDYLDDDVAVALTKSMFGALKPGGVLLVANFAPQLRDIGYMEAVMEWNLIYRDEEAVARFSASIPRSQIAGQTLFRDSLKNVVYLKILKGDQ